jgi:hypothetical protein
MTWSACLAQPNFLAFGNLHGPGTGRAPHGKGSGDAQITQHFLSDPSVVRTARMFCCGYHRTKAGMRYLYSHKNIPSSIQ